MLKRCPTCDVSYLVPRPTRKEVVEYFSRQFFPSQEKLEAASGPNRDRIFRKEAAFIKARKRGGRILDIGCAGGYFLGTYFDNPSWDKRGVDLSRLAAVRASERGISVQVGELDSANFETASFDVVTILDTFYYFPDPRRELGIVKRILKSDGLLLLEIPLAESRFRRTTGWIGHITEGDHFAIRKSDHLFFYSRQSIDWVLKDAGFKRTALEPLPANRQDKVIRNLLYQGYYAFSWMAWLLSSSRVLMAPRFLVAASPGLSVQAK